ncbi:mitochondrial proton/calcium exchanger protein-like protein isoform X1 [Tanacetum coccineum]
MYETKQMIILFLSRLNGYYYEEKKGSYGPQFSEAYSEASHINNSIPRKEKDLRSFTLPCFINNVCFDNALADLGAIVSVMPLSTYLNLGLGELALTKLTVELVDRTVKYPKGIAENVQDLGLESQRVLGTPLLQGVVRETGFTDLVQVKLIDYGESGDVGFGCMIFVVKVTVRMFHLELRRDQVDDLMPTIEEGEVVEEFRARNDARMVSKVFGYPSNCDHHKKIHIDSAHNLKFSCMIVLEDMDAYHDVGIGDVIFGEPF